MIELSVKYTAIDFFDFEIIVIKEHSIPGNNEKNSFWILNAV